MNVLADREPMRPPEQTRKNRKSHPGVLGNERLSALVGSVLLVLMLAEIVVAAQLRVLLSAHIVVGMLLTVPLLVKLGSVGYRFLSYYAGIRAYVRKGPPRLELRLLAPLLLVASVSLVMSGITLALLGPTNAWSVWVLRLHALSVICWLPLLALHVGVHIWRVPRLIIADWRNRATRVIPGRGWRYGITIFALLAGGGAAALFLPYTAAWVAWAPTLDPHIPGPLLFALFAAFLAGLGGLVVFRPWRWQEESGDRTRQS